MYLDGLVDTELLQNSIILRIIETFYLTKPSINREFIHHLANHILSTASIEITKTYQDVRDALIQGKTIMIFDGFLEVIIADTGQWKERALEESSGERMPNGMVFGFSENAIVGLTFITGTLFGNSGLTAAFSTLRFIIIILAYYCGYAGIIIGATLILLHMISLKSVGVPYLSPLIPFRVKEIKDSLYRGDLETLVNSEHRYPDDHD
ncbi:spore germination protein [Peribacillus sp. SI8-4]|uniref:spore germination protein n=1 Tax=Peribacillus sp. SI8-4 TaxID=3048009 RepID=UPI00255448DE|nr:spore germination protein [Peribacillus sp. SI8-4]